MCRDCNACPDQPSVVLKLEGVACLLFSPGFKKKFVTAVTWHLFDIRQFEAFLISVRHEFSAFIGIVCSVHWCLLSFRDNLSVPS